MEKSRSREAGSAGLGLSTVRSIAVSHGGTLRLSSTPEQGTTVTLTLPLAHGAVSAHRDDVLGNVALLSGKAL